MVMKRRLLLYIMSFVFLFGVSAMASHKGAYPLKRQHEGIDVKPGEAYRLIMQDRKNSHVVDVRTRFEYQDIGHAEGAYKIPLLFFSTEVGEKGYRKVSNNNFCRDLKARFNPQKDSLFMICRSAERSTIAASEAIRCGFEKEKVFNILGGFEGDKIHEEGSPFSGKRMVGGWRLENLPWTYKMDPELMYLPDLKK